MAIQTSSTIEPMVTSAVSQLGGPSLQFNR
jgi:hypothetical protein